MDKQRRVVTGITVDNSKASISFAGGVTEYLYAPFHLLRQEQAGPDRSAVIIWSNGSIRGYLLGPEAMAGLTRLPRAQPSDPLLTDPKTESLLSALQDATAPTPVAGAPLSATPSQGTLSTDGAFLTMEIDGNRTHFVVNRDPLPQLHSPPISAPDGSRAVALRMPDRSVKSFRVPPEHAIEMEKAVALMRSFAPVAPVAANTQRPIGQRYTVQPRTSAPQAAVVTREHPNGTTILVLGILGLVTCGVLAVVAWVMGNNAVREMDSQRNVIWSNRSNVNAGRVCGIIGTCLLVVVVVAWLIIISAASG